jgi:hypothetical protein
MEQHGWRDGSKRRSCAITACALALTLGCGQAHAAMDVDPDHDGGKGQDRAQQRSERDPRSHDVLDARPVAASPAAPARKPALTEAPEPDEPVADGVAAEDAATQEATEAAPAAEQPTTAETGADAEVAVESGVVDGEATDPAPRTRTTSRTVVTSRGIIKSVTRSFTYDTDAEGDTAIAKAVAKARVPNDVTAVENGAGRVIARTSAKVSSEGTADADAGGAIGVSGGKVEVSTWGRTSAEVY